MPKQHPEKLYRMSFRVDEPTRERLDRLARLAAARGNAVTPNRTAAIRLAMQITEAFDDVTFRDLHRILAKLQTGPDRSGTVALGEALKFAIKVAAAAVETPAAPPRRGKTQET